MEPEKRRPGRPKGSKNKPKEVPKPKEEQKAKAWVKRMVIPNAPKPTLSYRAKPTDPAGRER